MSAADVTARLFDVSGRRAVVTGAGSGLGLAIAEVLADCGARVTLADIDGERTEAEAARLAARGGDVRTAVADVADPDAVRELFRGVLFTMREAAAVMKPQRAGRIVVTASTAGLRADPMVCYGYAASKAAVINVARQAALELAPHGVHVNVIAPGPIKTRIAGGVTPEGERQWAALVPLGRMGEPDELKGLALLLASPASSFITGAVITIDGGRLLGEPGGW